VNDVRLTTWGEAGRRNRRGAQQTPVPRRLRRAVGSCRLLHPRSTSGCALVTGIQVMESNFMRRCILALLAGSVLTGCATIMHGSEQVIPVTSSPAGARVYVDGEPYGVAPLLLTVPTARGLTLSLTSDTLGELEVALTRRMSGWVIASALLNGVPVLVDVVSSSTHRLAPDTIAAAFPGFAPLPATAVRDWGLARGDRVRWADHEAGDVARGGVVDSLAAGRLFVRSAVEASSSGRAAASVSMAAAPRLAVQRQPDRVGGGLAGLHYASLAATASFLALGLAHEAPEAGFFAGAFWSAAVMPIGFLAGAATAQPRWSPMHAHRTGSPLRVDDRIRARKADGSGRISGRLVDADSAAVVIALRADTLRLMRGDIHSLHRAAGFDLRRGLAYGAAAGALFGMASCQVRTRCEGAEAIAGPMGGALLGIFISPALAPRRWQEVSSW
jgi:hypothetical protein